MKKIVFFGGGPMGEGIMGGLIRGKVPLHWFVQQLR